MGLLLGVFLAGGLGALTRDAVNTVVTRRWAARATGPRATFPVGTFVINVSGAAVLGLITGFVTAHAGHATLSTVAGTGFLGAYTTFSTEEWQTLGLRRAGGGLELVNVIGSLVASLILAGAGLWLGGRL